MRLLYSLVWLLALPFAFVYLLWRSRRQPEYRQHWSERLGATPKLAGRPVIWIHAVSVGETRAAEPLIRALRERHRDHTLLLTHTTPTGRATGRELYGDSVIQAYLPYDLPVLMARFLDRVRPELGILMETEVWPNLYAAAQARGLPLFLVNARLSQRSAQGYARFAALARPALAALSGVAAQTADDAQRLSALGARAVIVSGNLKFDVAVPPDTALHARQLRQLFGPRFVFLAASTRDGEEALILDAWQHLDASQLLVLVPRHPQRFDAVARLLEARGLDFVRRSDGRAATPETRVFLGDSMGEMAAYYSAADLAFVGGSLLPLGGQNLIEAAAVGCPTLIGPHTWNFAEASEQAIAAGCALRIDDVQGLVRQVMSLQQDTATLNAMRMAARTFTAVNQGATARVLAMLSRSTDAFNA